jgi:hypothetical protein
MELTPIEIEQMQVDDLQQRAIAIRDAVANKAVTPAMVGELFADLIDACGDVRSALDIFLNTNLQEIQQDIDDRLAGVDTAAENAAAEAQRAQATRTLVEELTATLQAQGTTRPTPKQVVIDSCPQEVTLAEGVHPQIAARAVPGYGEGGVLFIADNRALMITPDGIITPTATGTTVVNVVAVYKSTVYKQLTIAVVPPRMRTTMAGGMRLDANGNIRLT